MSHGDGNQPTRSKSWAAHQASQKTRKMALQIANLTVNNTDVCIFTALALLLLVNIRAIWPAVEFAFYMFVHSLDIRNFTAYITCCLFASFLSTANIKISSELRQAFSCFCIVYLLSAVDNFVSYHFDYDTHMDAVLSHVILIVNAYVLAHLFSDWRRKNVVGLAHYCANALRRCKISASCNYKVQGIQK